MPLLDLRAFFFFPLLPSFPFSTDGIDFGGTSLFVALVTGGGKRDSVSNGEDVPHDCPWAAVGVEEVSQVGWDPGPEEDG